MNVNKNITVKANAAKGYQAPSLWTKYSTGANRIPNPRVRPERIQYIDLSVSNYGKLFNWNVTGFVHRIEDAISSKRLPIKTGRYAGKDIHVNIGEYDISGIFGQIGVNYNSFRLFANATFTNGLKTNEKDINQIASSFPGYDLGLVNSNSESPILNTQIADIAKYKANAGITKTFDSKYIFATINIRANYVGEKMVGFGTTAPTNPGILTGLDQYNDSENINSQGKFQFNNASIPEYFLVNGNIMFSLKSLSGVRLGLQVRNILNEKFYHPGPAQAGSIIGLIDRPASMSYENYYSSTSQNKYVIYVPQMLRNFIFSVLYDF